MEALGTPPIPDGYFWYVLSTVLVTALIWVVNRYVNRVDRLFEKLTESINDLIQISKVHEHRLEDVEEDVRELKTIRKR